MPVRLRNFVSLSFSIILTLLVTYLQSVQYAGMTSVFSLENTAKNDVVISEIAWIGTEVSSVYEKQKYTIVP